MGSEVSRRPPVPPSVIPDQHQGSKSDFGGEVDIEEAIVKSGCSSIYYRLEDCLGEHDRDWRRCQEQVRQQSRRNYRAEIVLACLFCTDNVCGNPGVDRLLDPGRSAARAQQQ